MPVRLRCPLCRGTFPWDIVANGFPDTCEVCKEYVGHGRADDDVVMPSIRSARMALNDQVYRDIEKGSEHRVQVAAEQFGIPASDLSDLKITNLKDHRKQGEIAAPPLPAHLQNYGSFGGSNGVQFSPMVQSGPEPNAGARMRTALQQAHGDLSRGHAVCDTPALETTQPGYRRRG